jgi:hypothetical protein
MIKNVVIGLYAVLFVFTVSSCASIVEKTIWDESVPLEDCAQLYFSGGFVYFEPETYNGITINKRAFENKLVYLPAGQSSFTGTGFHQRQIVGVFSLWVTYRINDGISFSYNFQAGEKYTVTLEMIEDGSRERHYGIHIYNDINYSIPRREFLLTVFPITISD